MKEYKIWSEGFAATGQSGEATLHGTIEAKSFEDAILQFALKHKDFYNLLDHRPSDRGSNYTYWGCRIFDNEADARRAFG